MLLGDRLVALHALLRWFAAHHVVLLVLLILSSSLMFRKMLLRQTTCRPKSYAMECLSFRTSV
jgi:hypothetical protein